MKSSNSVFLLALGGVGLYLLANSGKAKAAPASGYTVPGGGPPEPMFPGSGPTGELPALNPGALPDLINANFPTPGQAPAPSPTPQAIQPEVNPASIPLPPVYMPQPVSGETPIVPPTTAKQPDVVPEDTAALARILLADEAGGNWKRTRPEVGVWQKARGLKVDNKFGPVSALRMADEIGTLPLVRYWPKGSQQQAAVSAFREALEGKASTASEPRKSQLLAAAAREQGQGFGSKPGKPATVISI